MIIQIFKYLILAFILLSVVLAVVSVFFSMNLPWWIDLIVPFVPFFIIPMGIILVVSLLMRNKLLIILSSLAIIVLLIVTFPLWRSLFVNEKEIDITSDADLTVMNYNIGFLYNTRDKGEDYYDPLQNPKALTILDLLENQTVDVLALQEFYTDSTSAIFNSIDRLKETYPHYYFMDRNRINSARKNGMAIFSKFPVINRGEIMVSENRFNGAQFADIYINNDTVRIINLHLESSQLGYLPSSYSSASVEQKLRWKWQHLRRTVINRREQANMVIDFAGDTEHALIIMGDFNAESFSGLLKLFKGSFNYAAPTSGGGLNTTFYDDRMWPVGLDHQFYNDRVSLYHLAIKKEVSYSNHRPVIGYYSLSPN